jgi:negative regulator of replication initiation
MNFVHLFATDASGLMMRLNSCREKMAPDAVVWISWPKKTSGVASEITEDAIRRMVLPTGLVDIKICAVDKVWSGLKFMIRKELR